MKYFLMLACLLWATPAYAYLDPVTGSLIIQSLIASVAAALFVIKLYWHKLKHFLFRKKDVKQAQGELHDEE